MIMLCLGFSLGAAAMWAHFKFSGLIRTREEFDAAESARRARKEAE